MLQHEMLHDAGVLIVKPLGPLAKEDFAAIARDADDYIESHGTLNGLMIYFKTFPGWKNGQGLYSHLRFVRDHHKNIRRVAFVTDTKIVRLVINIAKYFVHPEAKYFKYNQESSAMSWLSGA